MRVTKRSVGCSVSTRNRAPSRQSVLAERPTGLMYRRAVGKRKRGGSIALQVAVVLPVVLMFFFSLIDLSRFITMRQLLVNGAREGASLHGPVLAPVAGSAL